MASIWDPAAGGATVNANNTLQRQRFTAAEGQTDFTLTEFSYVPNTGSTIVFYNGAAQQLPTDYTELSASVIKLNFACSAGDLVDVIGFTGVSAIVDNIRLFNNTVIATVGQTKISTAVAYRAGTSSTAVYKNGVRLIPGVDYTETDNASFVTLTTSAAGGENYFSVVGQLVNDVGSDAALISFLPAGTGAVATTVEAKLNRLSISVKEYGVVGDGVTDDTIAMQNAVNAAVGKNLLGVNGESYLIRDKITVPSNVYIDLQGATIIDDVRTFRPANQASRAWALFYMYNVNNIKIQNFNYKSTVTRATVSNNVPTGIIWIGDNSTTGPGPTFDIEISNIQASNLANFSLFVAVVGEAYNLHIHDIDIYGDCSYGVNLEYGEAPSGTTDALAYGLHPYNVTVERFNGYDNATSVGFLRCAATYNVKFSNCYGKNVRSFIFCWTGDRSISRVSQNVVFENCSHYAASTFATGAVNYCVQIASVNKDGSTGDPLPAFTNYDHLFKFSGCQFQNNKQTSSSCVRFFGQQGHTLFENCIFRNSYYGVWGEPSTNPDYTSEFSLTFDECSFINNSRDVLLQAIRGVLFTHCKFKNGDGTLIPIRSGANSLYHRFLDCYFIGLASDIAYAVVDAGSNFNEFTRCVFSDVGATPPLDLSAPTFGSNNIFPLQGLTRQGWDYFGVLGEPSTLYESLAIVPSTSLDAYKRTQYAAETGAVSKTIDRIISGRIGDVVVVQSVSAGASVTFVDLGAGIPTLQRLITRAGGNLVKTGDRWTVTLTLTSTGWLIKD